MEGSQEACCQQKRAASWGGGGRAGKGARLPKAKGPPLLNQSSKAPYAKQG